jgi:hypothetical protein
MAEIRPEPEKAPKPIPEPRAGATSGDGPMLPTIDLNSLERLLHAHAEAMATAIGGVIADKLAEMRSEAREERRAEQRVSRVPEPKGEDHWLAKYPPGDREHLEKEEGDNRPPVKGEASWRLPKYEPVPRDDD